MNPALGGGGEARIGAALARAREAGRPALAPFLTAGFPSRGAFVDLLLAVASRADLVEIGVPFSDPMADGVTIQRSSRLALEGGTTLGDVLDVLHRLEARRMACPPILMSYLNPLLAFGIDALAREAAEAGVAGLIVPDLPFEECRPLRLALEARSVALVQLVTPVTPPARLRRLCRASRGFVYAVARTGTTGGASAEMADLADYLDRVRAASALPVLVGFGIRSREQLAAIAPHADGAIVGSALIEAIERGDDPLAFLDGLRAA